MSARFSLVGLGSVLLGGVKYLDTGQKGQAYRQEGPGLADICLQEGEAFGQGCLGTSSNNKA